MYKKKYMAQEKSLYPYFMQMAISTKIISSKSHFKILMYIQFKLIFNSNNYKCEYILFM